MKNIAYAMVFPGQGSQAVGMMNGLVESPCVRQVYEEASVILGQDMWAMVTDASHHEIDLTVNTQPAMLVAGVATWRAWLAQGGCLPAWLAGHSLGEYTALVAAGALAFDDALRLVRLRAELMQEAVPENTGAMAVILGMNDEAVRQLCREAAGKFVLEAVNFNAPGQVVIAGHKPAVELGMVLAKQQGAKRAMMLSVSVPSHCSLMRPAADALAQQLANVTIHAPIIPVLHNVDVQSHSDPEGIRTALVRQLYSPVRWVETVRKIADEGIVTLAECGPGRVLAGLTKRIDSRIEGVALTTETALTHYNISLSVTLH